MPFNNVIRRSVGTDVSRPLRDLNRDKDVILLFHEEIWICFWRIVSLCIR